MQKLRYAALAVGLLFIAGCLEMPGYDNTVTERTLAYAGVAEIKEVTPSGKEIYITFIVTRMNGSDTFVQNIKDIHGADLSTVKVGDRFSANGELFIRQRGTTTPQIIRSDWTFTPAGKE